VLHFEELDKHCANHFLARQTALRKRGECLDALSRSQEAQPQYVLQLRAMMEGWDVLAAAQSALAHSCMASFTLKAKKFEFMFGELKRSTLSLQQRFEEVWVDLQSIPYLDVKSAIRYLHRRLNDFLLMASAEVQPILCKPVSTSATPKAASTPSLPSPPRAPRLTPTAMGGFGGFGFGGGVSGGGASSETLGGVAGMQGTANTRESLDQVIFGNVFGGASVIEPARASTFARAPRVALFDKQWESLREFSSRDIDRQAASEQIGVAGQVGAGSSGASGRRGSKRSHSG
jgi:hypothetical protein